MKNQNQSKGPREEKKGKLRKKKQKKSQKTTKTTIKIRRQKKS